MREPQRPLDLRWEQVAEVMVGLDHETAAIVGALSRARFNYVDEHELQAGILAVLIQEGIAVTAADREIRLTARDRIDFLLPSGLGIEAKVAGTPGDVWRQLRRYTQSPRVKRLLLVTTRLRHMRGAPTAANGKTIGTILLRGGLL